MVLYRFRIALFFFWLSLELCASLNDEGKALLRFRDGVEHDPYEALSNWIESESLENHCDWFGVECSNDGAVVALNLKNLHLKGKLVPELGKLVNMKSIVLHNNSFWGTIPWEIGDLHKLEILDLSHNNLSGPLPSNIGSLLSLQFLVLRNNVLIGNIPPALKELIALSELLVDEELLSAKRISGTRNYENATIRRLLQEDTNQGHQHAPTPSPSPSRSPLSSPSPSPTALSPARAPSKRASPSTSPSPSPTNNNNLTPAPKIPFTKEGHLKDQLPAASPKEKHSKHWIIFVSLGAGAFLILALSALYVIFFRVNEVVTVMPWKTGLSGQLQKAFVTGVPSLRRSELQAACEDFSNVVGTLSDSTLYKGTLSNGTEIAVTSSMVTSLKDWSAQCETQFRKKISLISKVNHKNFMNLIGYCAEEEPFTRMMVYEYAPNGTLFEHLHIKEAEHLDWATRLKIIMGVSYCLEHMHQLDPSLIPQTLNSSTIYLSEDYAAKISELGFGTNEPKPKTKPKPTSHQDSTSEEIVYKFGIMLLEIISGRLQFSQDDGLLILWASSHLSGKRPLKDMVDATLEYVNEDDVLALSDIIKSCIDAEPTKRPSLSELVKKLRSITKLSPEAVTPKLSPLWWAELEIVSTESNSLE